jgi:hypothetical protein
VREHENIQLHTREAARGASGGRILIVNQRYQHLSRTNKFEKIAFLSEHNLIKGALCARSLQVLSSEDAALHQQQII